MGASPCLWIMSVIVARISAPVSRVYVCSKSEGESRSNRYGGPKREFALSFNVANGFHAIIKQLNDVR